MFGALASLLLPAGGGGVAIRAGEDWSLAELPSGVVVWGREPTLHGSTAALASRTASRERAARTLARHPSLRALHRWPPPEFRTGAWSRARATLRGGLVAELGPLAGPRVLDECARAAGADGIEGRVRPVTAGGAMARVRVRGRTLLLRAARAGGPGDPERMGEGLERLAAADVPLVPAPGGRGVTAGAHWSCETILSGSRPTRLTPGLKADVVRFALLLPRSESRPTAPDEDLDLLEEALPARASSLREVRATIELGIEGLPSVLVHGDLWAGNVLASRGRLSGVIDWDSWRPAGVPGTDLVQFVAATWGLRKREQVGEVWRRRPWRTLRDWASEYWTKLRVDPSDRVLDAVGASWWASRVAYRLRVRPNLVEDRGWLEGAVDPVLPPAA